MITETSNPFAAPASLLLRVKELEEQHLSFRNSLIFAFNQLLDLKDLNTGVHSTRLAEWAVRVARKLGIHEADFYQLEVAALLHDIGKIGVPDAILKKEGKLTDEERALMNKHPEYSWSILRLFPGLPHEEAVKRLIAGAGTQFDPQVVKSFVEIAAAEVADVFAATGTSLTAVI
jgi:HD-GYP domain-containing protein (c-di-GMP phosphodiesterase class II)